MSLAPRSTDPSASELEALAAQRVLVKAGPSGTALLALGLTEPDFRGERFAQASQPLAGNFDVLVLTQPALVERVHLAYLEAGADLIETNTFNAQAISQRKFGLEREVYELNFAAAQLSRRLADRVSEREPKRPRFVIGNLGPSEVSLSRMPASAEREQAFERVRAAYAEQARALIDGGVHALLLETVYDEETAKACVLGIRESSSLLGRTLPLLLSVTPGRDGRMASGRTVIEALRELESARPWSLGLNCGFGPESVCQAVEPLAGHFSALVSIYPNAGLPDAAGRYPAAATLVSQVAACAARGLVNLVGGCCGTTAAEIRALAHAVDGIPPRRFEPREGLPPPTAGV